MIGLRGQYYYIFNIANKKDFLQESDLIFFQTVEKSGNTLPTFKLEFYTTDETILEVLNGYNIEIVYGKDKNSDRIETTLLIQNFSDSRQGKEKIHIVATGILAKLEYHKTNVLITDKISSFQAIKQITSKNFIFSSNVTDKNLDNMNWIQYGISDKSFVDNIWFHSYIQNSFLCTGITLDNKFLLTDIRKKISEKPNWNFKSRIDNDNDIIFDGDCIGESKAGFINAWLGYQRYKNIYDLNDSEFITENAEISIFTALSKKLMRNASIETKNSQQGYISDSVHQYYHRAYLNNLSNLAVFSSYSKKLSFQNQFKKINILDTALFKEPSLNNSYNSVEYSSGIYIVSKVSRILQNRQLITIVELCRESINHQKGNLV